MTRIILILPHKCPYCNSDNFELERSFGDDKNIIYKAPGDSAGSLVKKRQHFFFAKGVCDYCHKQYKAKIAISNGMITSYIKTFRVKEEKNDITRRKREQT